MNRNIVGLDLGTSKASVVVAELSDLGEVSIVGVGESPSDGLKKGYVVDIEKAVRSIKSAVLSAERMSGLRVEQLYVTLGGAHIASQNCRGTVAITGPSRQVDQNDVERAIEASKSIALASDRVILHVIPREYTVDGQAGVKKAIGMIGRRLEVDSHIITASATAAQNVISCVEKAGYAVGDVYAQGLASAEGVLANREKEMGVVLVDIGAGTTDVVVYQSGAPLQTAVIPVGGDHITNDISYGLQLGATDAEALKLNYGHAVPNLIPDTELIELKREPSGRVIKIRKRTLAKVIGPRMQEILELAFDQARKSGFEGVLAAGVVLTGGSARLGGAQELAESIFNLPTRIGQPLGVGGFADRVCGPSHAASVGLVKLAVQEMVAEEDEANEQVPIMKAVSRLVEWVRRFV